MWGTNIGIIICFKGESHLSIKVYKRFCILFLQKKITIFFRYLVGESNVSRTYKNILELISNPSALSARAEELSTNLQARSAGRDVSSNAVSKRGTPLAGSPVKGIRNYFKLSESSDTNQELEKPRGQLLPDIQVTDI